MSSEMEIDRSIRKECVALPAPAHRITRCETSGTVAVWNNHSVYLYDENRLQKKPVSVNADFVIQMVLLSNSSLVCIDSNGIAHTLPLKFKSSTVKCIKIPFNPKAQGVLSCCQINADTAVSVTHHYDLMLCVHRINTEFNANKTYNIQINTDGLKDEMRRKIMLKAYRENVNKNVAENVFKMKSINSENEVIMVLFSFDRFTIYGQIIDQKATEETIEPVKLFTCPTEMADFQAVNNKGLKIIIGLKSGTVVYLSCAESKLEAKIIYLNSAIYKMIVINDDNIMYTNGMKLWTVENFISEKRINFKEVFVEQAKDLIKNDNIIMSITFSNMLYRFCLDTDDIYIKQAMAVDGFFPIPRDLTYSQQIITKIVNEVQRNEEILNKIKSENTLMTAVALSRQNSILDKHITFTTHIFNRYEDVLTEHNSVTLTQPLKDYFEPHTVLLLVKLETSSEFRQKFNEICSSLWNSIQLHVSTSYGQNSATTAIPLENKTYENFTCLIPSNSNENPTCMNLTIKIVSPISGPLDVTENFWTILHSKVKTLYAEHFIKADTHSNVKICRNPERPPDEKIMEIAKRNHGSLFDFEIPQRKNGIREWNCYLKLPKDFHQKLGNVALYARTLNNRVSEFLSKKFGSNEFCKGYQLVYITVHNHKVAFHITAEENDNVLKISGSEVSVVFELRQFFSGLIYEHIQGGIELIAQSQYTRIENLRRKLKDVLAAGGDAAAILEIAHQFHRYTLGALPL